MGAAASNSPPVGVALNPRVEYASKLAQAEGKSHLIDAPVLVDLPQGSIRYRFVDRRTQPNAGLPNSNLSLQSSDIPDGPHRGCNDLQHKKGYFFQAKLADYSTEANKSHPAAEYKFKYVYNGPRCAKNKRLFYVTGTGLPVDHESLSSDLNTPTWPNIATENNHVYYSLHFLSDDADIDEGESEKINSNAPILMKLNADDSIEALKENVSMHILKPTTQIHIFYQQHEIRPETEVNGLRGEHTTLAELKVRLIKLK